MMNETAATGGVIYADEGSYTIDVRHLCLASIANFAMADFEQNVEEMVGITREAADGGKVRRDEMSTRPGTRPAVSGTRPAATAGDELDGGDWWGNVYGRRGVRI